MHTNFHHYALEKVYDLSIYKKMINLLSLKESRPYTFLLRGTRNDEFPKMIKDHHSDSFLYGSTENDMYLSKFSFEKLFMTSNKSEMKSTNKAFSVAILEPEYSQAVSNYLMDHDNFMLPDFETKIRNEMPFIEETEFDFEEQDKTPEELLDEQKAKHEAAVEKRIKEAYKTFHRAVRKTEDDVKKYRQDYFLLSQMNTYLKPGGIMMMILPLRLIDGTISKRLSNQFDDIHILRFPLEHAQAEECLIIGKKKEKAESNNTLAYEISHYKFKDYNDLPVLGETEDLSYEPPIQNKDKITTFRIGPITDEEISEIAKKSTLLETFNKKNKKLFKLNKPSAPTPLHDGHIMLLLTSGLLNGYIGSGVDRHLVKGSVQKKKHYLSELNENNETVNIEKEYYDINLKYLNRYGQFITIM